MYWPSQFKRHDKIVISLSKRHLWITWRQLLFKVQYGCLSHGCKLDLGTIQGNLTGDQYIKDVLQPIVVPHFDNHPLPTRHVYMDDNARPHRSRWSLMSVYQQWTFNDSPWLKSRWFQTVSNCSCWQTFIGQPVLFEYGTGCKWHPSNQTLQCPVTQNSVCSRFEFGYLNPVF
jgi:hypothetical protein